MKKKKTPKVKPKEEHGLTYAQYAAAGRALKRARKKLGLAEGNAVKCLREIAGIIEAVGNRCMAADGPVTGELDEMTEAELRKIYRLAKGSKKS